MRKFTIKIVLFICLFLILDNCFDIALGALSKRTNLFYTKMIKEKPQVVFLGDSKIRHSIIPELIEDAGRKTAYNLSKNGSGIIYNKGVQSVILEHYKPDIFVVQAMSLANDRSGIVSLMPFLNYKGVKELLSYYPFDISLRYSLFKSSKHNWMLLSMIKGLFNDQDHSKGYVPRYGVSNKKRTEGLSQQWDAQVAFGNVFKDFKMPLEVSAGNELLASLIEEANKNNVQVVIIAMPLLGEDFGCSYYSFKKMAERYGLPFLDYTHSLLKEGILKKQHFLDSDHLNHEGAKIFSRIVGSEIGKM